MSNSRIIVADGNNVAYYGVKNNIPRISHLLALIENFKDDKLIIIVSPALKYKIDDKSKLKELIKTKIVLESPPRENDDKYILEITKKLSAAIIISYDCFIEFEIS